MRTRRLVVLILSAGLLALSPLFAGVGGATGSSVAEVPPDPGTGFPTDPCTDDDPTECTWNGG
jgi:hypothetical protein